MSSIVAPVAPPKEEDDRDETNNGNGEDESSITNGNGTNDMGGGRVVAADLLPILIIPGFMSSQLEVQESSIRRDWQGKRLWINLGSLGFQSIHLGGAAVKDGDGGVGGGGGGSCAGKGTGAPDGNNGADSCAVAGAGADDSSKIDNDIRYKSDWLGHLALKDDMITERDGIRVRPVPGLAGVDYLTPGPLTSLLSYVFGPVIKCLLNAGYQGGKNLDAAPYDWRIPPSELERRDGYFSDTMNMVERLYENNNKTPVVLMCHSLGSKVGHYFLNFCLREKGRDWIDEHVHTYMPVGGAHIGAPVSLRGVVSGDNSTLGAFLTDEENLACGRTLGSVPWLIPDYLPAGAPSCSYRRPQGCLEVTVDRSSALNVEAMLRRRIRKLARPVYFKLAILFAGTTLTTDVRKKKGGYLEFTERFFFATDADAPAVANCGAKVDAGTLSEVCSLAPSKVATVAAATATTAAAAVCPMTGNNVFQVILLEPTLHMVPCFLPCRLGEHCLSEVSVSTSVEATLSRVLTGFSILAASSCMKVSDILGGGPSSSQREAKVNVPLFHRTDRNKGILGCCYEAPQTIDLNIQWKAPEAMTTMGTNSIKNDQPKSAVRDVEIRCDPAIVSSLGDNFETCVPCPDILEREGLSKLVDVISDVYGPDPLDPRGRSSLDAPPVTRVKAIYGVNLPTEVGAVYRLTSGSICGAGRSRHVLDRSARLAEKAPRGVAEGEEEDAAVAAVGSAENGGLLLRGGLLLETTHDADGSGRRMSGDGAVPYYSLRHPHTWKDSCH